MNSRIRRKNDEGVALILALLFVVLLSVLVVEFCYESQVEASYTANQGTDFEAQLAARSAVARGLGLLAEDLLESQGGGAGTSSTNRNGSMFNNTPSPGSGFGLNNSGGSGSTRSSFKQLAGGGTGATGGTAGGTGTGTGAGTGTGTGVQEDNPYAGFMMDSMMDPVPWHYGIPFEPLNNALMRTTIADESGKINLNALLERSEQGGTPTERQWLIDTLLNFLRYRAPDSPEPPEALVDALLDWMDYDDTDQTRPDGAELDYYQGLEIPYTIKNGPLDSIEELLLVKGWTPDLFYGNPEEEQLPLSEYLTVHGDWNGRINVNTAPVEVLQSVFEVNGGDPAMAAEVYERVRVEQPYTDATQLQGLLPEPEEEEQQQQGRRGRRQQEQVPEDPSLDPGAQQSVTAQALTVNSSFFRIYGDGMYEDSLVRIIAYVYRNNSGGNPAGGGETIPPPEEPFRVLSWALVR